MTIQVTGKNIKVGESLRSYSIDRVEQATSKYLGKTFPGHVRIEKVRNNFETTCTLNLWNGMVVNAHGVAVDPHNSVDEAVERLEKRLRRYKRRLKNHHQNHTEQLKKETSAQMNGHLVAMDYLVKPGDHDEGTGTEPTPVIVAETEAAVSEMSVSDAVMLMDLGDQHILVFKNKNQGAINIVYRREDGNIGWIDPAAVKEKSSH